MNDNDTITIDNLDYKIDTSAALTSSILGPYPSYNVGVGATGSNGPYTYATNSTGGWHNTVNIGTTQPTMKVQGDAEFQGKVMINGRNISEFMETISKRLAILQPDPAKLEHFAALKKAYDHYKVLEALCELPTEPKE